MNPSVFIRVYLRPVKRQLQQSRGVTLVEMLVVVMILSVLAGISYPSMSAAIDSLRINSASTDVVAFFNTGLNRAERRQHAIEVTILPVEGRLLLASPDPRFYHRLDMPTGVFILSVLPEIPGDPRLPRQFLLFPGGTVPRVGVLLGNSRGDRRMVRVDPITGVPQIARLERSLLR